MLKTILLQSADPQPSCKIPLTLDQISQVEKILEQLGKEFRGDRYHLMNRFKQFVCLEFSSFSA